VVFYVVTVLPKKKKNPDIATLFEGKDPMSMGYLWGELDKSLVEKAC
jgi:hypothetical protein